MDTARNSPEVPIRSGRGSGDSGVVVFVLPEIALPGAINICLCPSAADAETMQIRRLPVVTAEDKLEFLR